MKRKVIIIFSLAIAVGILLTSSLLLSKTGGPDSFGYRWINNLSPDPTTTFSWVDIAATGTNSGVSGDDVASGLISIGFNFPFYGQTFSQLNFSTNGVVTFGGATTQFSNTQIPSTSSPNNFIAVFFDDLFVFSDGRIFYRQFPAGAIASADKGRAFVIEWFSVGYFFFSGRTTFEVILFENGEIKIQYLSISGRTDSATVGIENSTGTVGLQYNFNGSGDPIGGGVAILFSPPALPSLTSITVTPANPTINVGQTQPFTATGTFSDGSTQVLGPSITGSISIGFQPVSQIAVNPNTDRIYLGGGYAQNPVMVINAASPANPTIVTTVTGTGAAVNPVTNRFYASTGFGGQILVYDGSTNSIITGVGIGFCGGQFDIDSTKNLIYTTSQCGGGNDPLHVLNGATNAIVAGPLGSGGVVSTVRVNSATGRGYVSRSGGTRVFGPPPSFSVVTDLNGIFIQAVNSVTNRLYFQSGSDLPVLDGTSHSTIAIIPGTGGPVGVNTSLNRLYVLDPTNKLIRVFDGATNTGIGSFSLGATVTPYQIGVDSTKNRLYVAGSLPGGTSILFVLQDSQAAPLGWSSSNTAVATINQTGLATGLSPGATTITATSGTISGSTTLTVVSPTFTLSVSRVGTGSGTVTSSPAGIHCGPDCTEAYTNGTTVTLTATPASGSAFAGWTGGGCSGTGTCTVTMNADTSVIATFTNQPPTANSQSVTTPEDTAKAITLTGSDPEGASLTFTIATGPANGTLISGTPPNVTYTPNLNFNGTDRFTFKANDGLADSNIATVTITVNAVNDPPTFDPIANQTVAEDAPLQNVTITGVSPGPADEAGQTVSFTATSSNPAVIPNPTISGTGSTRALTYQTVANANGTVTITVTANDGQAQNNTFSRTFTITVTPVNDVPVLGAIGNKTVNEGALLIFVVSATDVDGDPLTFSATGLPPGATLDPVTRTFIYTPGFDVSTKVASSFFDVFFTVSDGQGGTASETVRVTVIDVNRPPVANAGPDQVIEATSPAGASVTLNGTGSSDPDGDTLTFAWTNPSFVGVLTGATPSVQLPLGTHTITLTVTDTGGATVTDTVLVTVRDTTPPTGTVVINGGAAFTNSTSVTLTLTCTDIGTGCAHMGILVDGTAVAPLGTPIVSSKVIIMPTGDGLRTVQVLYHDGADAFGNQSSATDTIVLDTTAPAVLINTPIAGDGFINSAESTSVTITGTVTEGGSGVSSVTVKATNGTITAPDITATVNGVAPTFTFTATLNVSALTDGTITFTATATDGAGNQGSDSKTATLDKTAPIAPVVDLPAFVNIANQTTVPLTVTGEVGAAVSFSVTDGVTTVSGAGTISGTGTFSTTVTLSTLADGLVAATATLSDAAGNTSAAGSDTAMKDTVAPAAPSTPDLAAASDSGSSNTDNITNDTTPTFEGTAEAGSTVAVVDGATPLGTTVTSGTGAWSVTTPALADGVHSITTRATDAAGNTSAASAALRITIDKTQPTVTITSPANNGSFIFGAVVASNYHCTDAISGVASCSGPVPSGANFNTSTLGSKSFSVTAIDNAGNSAATANFYSVIPAPIASTVTVTPNLQQYSDRVDVTASLPNTIIHGQSPTAVGNSVTFFIGSQNIGVCSLALRGNHFECSLRNLALLEPVPFGTAPVGALQPSTTQKTVTTVFGGVNPNFAVINNTTPLTIRPEDARVTYTGALFTSTACATCSDATVTLAVTIKDISATSDAAGDADPGDIRNAKVRFVNRDTFPNTTLCTADVGLVNLDDTKTGTATCSWARDIGSADSVSYTVGIVVENYYIRNSSDDNTVITVSKPLDNFITGGGYLILSSSAGLYPGGPDTKNNWGFNVKYNKSGTNLQGHINIIVRNEDRVYQIKGNAMTSLAVKPSPCPAATATSPCIASFNGKANIQDITDPLNPISIAGNGTLQVTMADKGETGSSDTIGITLWNRSGGLWFSSNWNGTVTVEQALGGGNLVVH